MNIFYLHRDPVKAATVQYNKHVVKMILESAQMLCTAHHCYGSAEQKANIPYRQSHLNHPSTVWVRRSVKTYIHKCKDFLATPPKHIQGSDWCEPPQCMPDQYKVDGDSVSAYWNYYENEKHTVRNSNEKLITRQ
jgi:hypothetical protein